MIRFRIQIGAQSADFSTEDSVVTFGSGPKNTIQVNIESRSTWRISPVIVTLLGWSDPRHHSTDFQTIGRFTKKTTAMIAEIVRLELDRIEARMT